MPPLFQLLAIAFMAILAIHPSLWAQESLSQPRLPAPRDVFHVGVDPLLLLEAEEGQGLLNGRLLILLCEAQGRRAASDPIDAPFLSRAQPIASIAVTNLTASMTVHLGDGISGTSSTPANFDKLKGQFNVRAVFDRGLKRSHNAPGNLISPLKTIEFTPGVSQTFALTLEQVISDEPLPKASNIKWIEVESPILSAFSGRRTMHRAGVVLPPEYHDTLAKRRYWPTIYVVPGFGGDHRGAEHYARLLADPAARALMPTAVWVILDPNAPLGHHGFVDSQNNGPRARALVEEFIPWLEKRFRIIPRTETRIITGHSSGGWSSLWLQLQHPDVFGACFASAPDPVSFSEFGAVNLYRDLNLFKDENGVPRPSLRTWLTPQDQHVLLTIADEVAMERALTPEGTSGEQWDAWNAMFSSRDPDTLRPRRAFDPVTGEIDPAVIEHDWVPHDITLLLQNDWPRYGPLFEDRIRLICGEKDDFYLERAVERLKEVADARRAENGSGYIVIIPNASHSTIVPMARQRFFQDMRSHLETVLSKED